MPNIDARVAVADGGSASDAESDSGNESAADDGSMADDEPAAADEPTVGDGLAIRASGVEKAYGSWLPWEPTVEVLDDAAIEIERGELVGIVGENGSGKSTLMQILVGALAPDAGTVERGGTVGWCPQDPLLYDRLTVRETMRLFGEAYGLEEAHLEERVDWLSDRLDFEQYLDTRIDRLSGGNRQKVNLSVALLHDPDVLLLDEPYTGFDWETYLAFWELTDELAADGTAIAIISHFVEDRDRFDAIFELRDGGLTEDGGGSRGDESGDGSAVPGSAGDAARADRTSEVAD